MGTAAAITVVIYLVLFGFLKYVEHEVKETSTVKQQVFFSDNFDPDAKATLTPALRDTAFENLLEDLNGYSSKEGFDYSSKDGYSSKSSKGGLEDVAEGGHTDVLDRLFIPPIPPTLPPLPPRKPPVVIDPHVITNVNPPMN